MAELTGTHRDVQEMLGSLTAESVAGFRNSGAGRLLQPSRYGGFGLSADEFVAAVCDAAALDGSLGWLVAAFNVAAADLATLPERAAHDVWGARPDALIAASHDGSGTLSGGRLSGRWESVVGAGQADWFLLPADGRRVLVACGGLRIEPVERDDGLGAAGIRDVTALDVEVDDRRLFTGDRGVLIAANGAAAAVIGSADGVWRSHVDQVRARLATSYGGDEVTTSAAAQVARAASDIDAARLQITTALQQPVTDLDAAAWAHRQAIARARDAADRLLGSSRHALDASDPVSRRWRDVHAGYRLAVRLTPRRPR